MNTRRHTQSSTKAEVKRVTLRSINKAQQYNLFHMEIRQWKMTQYVRENEKVTFPSQNVDQF